MTDIIDRAHAYLNCDAELDKLDVTNLVAAMHDEIARLRADLDEQCRLIGMGGEREARLIAAVEELQQVVATQSMRLAESQARERRLREALTEIASAKGFDNIGAWARNRARAELSVQKG